MKRKNNDSQPYDANDKDAEFSKTQKKQMVHDLQELSKTITAMPKKRVQQLDLPESFIEAIAESKRITSHIARKRHFQYMGKILLNADHQSIMEQIQQQENLDGQYQVRDAVINLWIEQFSDHEAQLFDYLYQNHERDAVNPLRQTLLKHRKKPNDAANRKKLFQALRQFDKSQELPNPLTLVK